MVCSVYENTESVYVYNTWGAAVSEVEVDVLTGQTQILRVDILYDCGESINPEIDIGQVEGAFVMGLGYWLTEKVEWDDTSGQLLTHNTWVSPSHMHYLFFGFEFATNTSLPSMHAGPTLFSIYL